MTTNSVESFKCLLTGQVRDQPAHWIGAEVDSVRFLAPLATGEVPKVRSVEVTVAPDGIMAEWDGGRLRLLPTERAVASLERARTRFPPQASLPLDEHALFGGVGLIVFNGSISVKDLRIAQSANPVFARSFTVRRPHPAFGRLGGNPNSRIRRRTRLAFSAQPARRKRAVTRRYP